MVANSADMLDDTLLGFLLGKSGDEHFMMETVIVFVKDPITMEDFTIEAFMGETSLDIKEKIYRMKGYPIEQQRLVFAGRQTADLGTISSHNIQTGNKIHVNMWMHGGAKKGVKKTLKAEKQNTLMARLHYTVTQTPQTQAINIPTLCDRVSSVGFFANAIRLANHGEITAINASMPTTSRCERLGKTLAPLMIPEIVTLMNERAAIDNSIKAIEEAMELGLVSTYWIDKLGGIDTKPLIDAAKNRMNECSIEAEVARRAAGAAPAAAAAPAAEDADM